MARHQNEKPDIFLLSSSPLLAFSYFPTFLFVCPLFSYLPHFFLCAMSELEADMAEIQCPQRAALN